MTQEEKDLVVKDLCGRLPYGVMLKHISTEKPFKLFSIKRDEYASYKKDGVELAVNGIYYDWYVNDIYHDIELYIKPYLRPLSSMTEKEKDEFLLFFPFCRGDMYFDVKNACVEVFECPHKITLYPFWDNVRLINWLNKNMFDYRGLIPKGLALEAKDGMYNN